MYWKGCDRKWLWPNLTHHLSICVEGMREHQVSQSSSTEVKDTTMIREFLLKYILNMGNIKIQNDDMHRQIC
jgi:hypothetical protein